MRSKKPQKQRAGRHQLPRPDSRLAKLADKVARGPLGGSQFVVNPKGQQMMSEVLADFIAPYAGTADTKDDHQQLLTLAATAWNAALFPVDKRGAMLDEVLTTSFGDAPQSLKSELRAFINELVERKEAHFADNRRAIVDFTLQETHDGYHLSVASTLEGTPAE